MNIPIFEACYLQNISLLNDWWQSSDDLLELYSFIMKTIKAHTSIKTNFVPQSYPTPSKKVPTKPINTSFVGIHLFIQTLGRRDLSGCFLVHICAFYSSYSSYFAFLCTSSKIFRAKMEPIIKIFC